MDRRTPFLAKLNELGYTEIMIRNKGLPDWWPSGSEELELLDKPGGAAEYLMRLARYTGIDYLDLKKTFYSESQDASKKDSHS